MICELIWEIASQYLPFLFGWMKLLKLTSIFHRLANTLRHHHIREVKCNSNQLSREDEVGVTIVCLCNIIKKHIHNITN